MIKLLLIALFQAAPVGQTVQGVVLDSVTGAPLAGAYVSGVMGTAPPMTRTDTAGVFRLEGVPGPLRVARAGYLEAPNVQHGRGADASIRLMPEAVVSGTLEDEDGFPVVDAMVNVMQYRDVQGERRLTPVRWGRSNDLGEYRIGGVRPGRYYLQVSNGNARNWDSRYTMQYFGGATQPSDEHMVEVKLGEQHGGVDVRLLKFEGVALSGRLEGFPGTAPGQRMPWLQLRLQDGNMYSGFDSSVQLDGTFQIRHVMPGRYTLMAQTGNGMIKAGDLMAQLPVEVGSAEVRDLSLTFHTVQAVDVPGTIVVEGGGTPGRMLISARGNTGGGVTAHAEEDGTFVLKGLLPGHYNMQVVAEFSSIAASKVTMMPVSAILGEKEVLRKGFDVDSPPVGPMKITLAKPIEVKGTIVDAAGQPVANRAVLLQSATDQSGALTNAQGAFRMVVRLPGEFHVYVLDTGFNNDLDVLKEHANDFPVVRVVAGENAPLVLRAPR